MIPIIIYFAAFILKLTFGRRPRFNSYFLKRGGGMLLIAIFFFIRGLDENQDYLRINHGMWHCLAGTSSFFIWQSIDKDKPIDAENVKYSNQNRYTYWYVIKRMLTLKVFSEDTINVHKNS